MKTLIASLILFFGTNLNYFAQNAEADKILGTWLTNEGKAKIVITKYGEKFGGKIIWLKTPLDEQGQAKVDKKNPDLAKRKNPLIGLSNLLGFVYAGNGAYENGTIYDPANGKTYQCNIKLEGNILKVRGFIGMSLIGRTEVWTRIN